VTTPLSPISRSAFVAPRTHARGNSFNDAAWMALLEEDSSMLRRARPGQLDQPYGTAAWNQWDLFPAADPHRPCLVLLHGADRPEQEWKAGDWRGCSALAEGLRAHGWASALPGRGLSPAASPTRIVRDTHKALDWLGSHGPQHGISGPVILAGWGAGADLAALLLDHPVVKAGVGICGLYDLETAPVCATELEVIAWSPLRLPVVGKPFIIAHDGGETAASAAAWHAARNQGGATGRMITLPGQGAARLLDSLRAPDGALCRAVLDLVG
jgi:arylformamidase